jgi:hypothetical protein
MPLFGRKEEQNTQEKTQPTDKIVSNGDKREQIIKDILTNDSPTLKGIINASFKKIIDNKEFPSLGHAIDSIREEYRKNLHPNALRAYTRGYFHLVPMILDEAVGIDKIGIYELGVDNIVRYQNYAKPGMFLLYELLHPEKAQSLYEHQPGQCSKEELRQEIGKTEPVMKKGIFPKFIVQTLFLPDLFFLILEFNDRMDAHYLMLKTKNFWNDFIVKNLRKSTAEGFLKEDKGLLVLDLPMSAYPPDLRMNRLIEQNRVWWRQGNIIISVLSTGTEGKKERTERKTSIMFFLRALNDNEKYLKLNP